jgi:EF-P beta-lysylation protein EpmB
LPAGLYSPTPVITGRHIYRPEKRVILDKNHYMLQHKRIQAPAATWQRALAGAVRDPAELLTLLELSAELLPAANAAARQFPLRVPRGFVARMKKGDPADPLLRQVLPLAAELEAAPGYNADPVGDDAAVVQPGLLQKYHGRVLIMTTAACAVHCRYCFRRHFPYQEQSGRTSLWHTICEHIAADDSISEVILSGGDPLSLNDQQLRPLVERLEAIPHLKRLRIHSRQPVVLPERIDTALLDWLGNTRLTPIMVIHCNHANEIDNQVRGALTQLKTAGISLLNQTVLLRGVNDDAATLCQLSETLFEAGVIPYYLHLLDKVAGAAHFDVDQETAGRLVTEMRKVMPGYLVPRLVQEVAQKPYKQPL